MNRINNLYIHIPFCKNKCDYCAFHSIPCPSVSAIDLYFKSLKNEIDKTKELTKELDSIYIGGGTPSLLSVCNLEKLFKLIHNNFKISDKAEISIECNPDSLDLEKIKLISGFANRISLGIQSFNSEFRQTIGRKGSIKKLDFIFDNFLNNNIYNLSADLIYAIPTQTVDNFREDLNTLLNYPIKHTSLYSLTFEEGTKLSKESNCNENDFDELSAEMWQIAEFELGRKNINRYEVSNYAKEGYKSKHNMNTWFGGTYLGLGPTASSFDGKIRWNNQKYDKWLKYVETQYFASEKENTLYLAERNGIPEIDKIPRIDRFIEIFIMGLRTSSPWTIEEMPQHIILRSNYNTPPLTLEKHQWVKLFETLSNLKEIAFLNIEQNKNTYLVSSTKKGMLFWNTLAVDIMTSVE